jgi:ketosteroid isomerase-like protein
MGAKEPVEVVLAFLDRINARDVDGLCAMMADGHVFIDGLGNRMQGRETMRKGWTGYFKWFPDYRISHEEIFSQGEIVAAFGWAEGTYGVNGKLSLSVRHPAKLLGKKNDRDQIWPSDQ